MSGKRTAARTDKPITTKYDEEMDDKIQALQEKRFEDAVERVLGRFLTHFEPKGIGLSQVEVAGPSQVNIAKGPATPTSVNVLQEFHKHADSLRQQIMKMRDHRLQINQELMNMHPGSEEYYNRTMDLYHVTQEYAATVDQLRRFLVAV